MKEIEVIEIENISKEGWDELVKNSPVATWFQTYEAYIFFSNLSFLEAFAFAVRSEGQLKGLIVGYIQKDGDKLKQFFSRRAIILGGPLLAADISDVELMAMLDALKKNLRKRVIYIETRNFNDYSHWRKFFEAEEFIYDPHYDIIVDTSSSEAVDANLGKSRKRDIRVSLREGASIVQEPELEQVRQFYVILERLYKEKVKTPLFPIEFFESLYEHKSSKFLLVEYNGEIIGGTVCVGLEHNAVYELYACGKDRVYKNVFPSELATYGGLQFAVEKGFPRFDMMGAGKPGDGGYGVRDFKLKFGGELLELGRYIHVCNPLLFSMGSLAVKILKKV